MNETDLIRQQDELRTKRSFVSFLAASMGLGDQAYAGQDGYAVNPPRRYQTIGINGTVGVEGAPISSAQPAAVLLSPGVLLLAAVAIGYLVLKK